MWRFLVLVVMVTERRIVLCEVARSSGTREYCQRDGFEARCGNDEVLVITSAVYGRMRLGRCVQVDFGYVGCSADVLAELDRYCSGKRACTERNLERLLAVKPCLRDLKSYLEASFDCLKVASGSRSMCRRSPYLLVTGTAGFLASQVTEDTGCGSKHSPWRIEARPGQRVNVTIFDFSHDVGPSDAGVVCYEYALIKDNTGKTATICNGRKRRRHAFLSEGHKVEVHINTFNKPGHQRRFIFKYEVIGCARPRPSAGMWVRQKGDVAEFGCDGLARRWTLHCKDGGWTGLQGNCSGPVTGNSLDNMYGAFKSLPSVYTVIIIVTVGVIIGIFILLLGIVIIRRRKTALPPKYGPATIDGKTRPPVAYYAPRGLPLDIPNYNGHGPQNYTAAQHYSQNEYSQRGELLRHDAGQPLHQQKDVRRPRDLLLSGDLGTRSHEGQIEVSQQRDGRDDDLPHSPSFHTEHIYESPVFGRKEAPRYFELERENRSPDETTTIAAAGSLYQKSALIGSLHRNGHFRHAQRNA